MNAPLLPASYCMCTLFYFAHTLPPSYPHRWGPRVVTTGTKRHNDYRYMSLCLTTPKHCSQLEPIYNSFVSFHPTHHLLCADNCGALQYPCPVCHENQVNGGRHKLSTIVRRCPGAIWRAKNWQQSDVSIPMHAEQRPSRNLCVGGLCVLALGLRRPVYMQL